MYILNETLNNGYNIEFISFLSFLSIFLGIAVIITKNPVISVLFLIGLFFNVSLYLMMIGLYFIGLSYLLVYVGAISILFLFILMLINVRISELVTEGKNSMILSIITILTITFSVNKIIPYSFYIFHMSYDYLSVNKILLILNSTFNSKLSINNNINDYVTNDNVANVYSVSWDNILMEVNHISNIGNLLYTNLFIFLIITSLILLLAMVGSIVITIKKT